MTFKRLTGIILALVMLMPQLTPAAVSAAETGEEPALKAALDFEAAGNKQELTPEENTAVVLFKEADAVTKKEIKAELSKGENAVKDIKVKEVWDFSDEESKSGKSLSGTEGDSANIAVVSSDSLSTEKLVDRLNKRDDVEIVEPNYRVHALSITNDAYSDLQWSMQSDEIAPNIKAQWDGSTEGAHGGVDGSEKIVAIIDTGIDYTHPELKDMMWENDHYPDLKGRYGYDFVNGDGDPLDDNGHGTHCAGIIGASGDNEEGISGVNKNIKLMALKMLDYEGSSYLSHEIAAYNYINMALDLGEPVVAINNSWGGGDESKILERLINIVGEKGAVTVCAAGNEASNNDEEPVYPASIESPYKVSVAAYNEYGDLASYSNYGDTVDVAAPGSDILSTVSYNIYNPTIYKDNQDEMSSKYNDYASDSNTWALPGTDDDSEYPIYLDGKKYTEYLAEHSDDDEKTEITVERSSEGFLGDNGSLKMSFKNVDSEAVIGFALPYEIAEEWKTKPVFSAMVRINGPDEEVGMFGSAPLFGFVDIDADAKLDISTLNKVGPEDLTFAGGNNNSWSHLTTPCCVVRKNEDETNRKVFVFLYAYFEGDYTIEMDDVGRSNGMLESEEAYGKYDFYSGTSMATPYVTGAVALKAAAMGDDYDAGTVVNEISTQANFDHEVPVITKGTLDFRVVPGKAFPKIRGIKVDTQKKELVITGTGFGEDKEALSVKLKDPDEPDTEYREAEIIQADEKSITIKDDKWINNLKDIQVTRDDGKKVVKRNAYLVAGKKEYSVTRGAGFEYYAEHYTTDGTRIYTADKTGRDINKINPKNGEDRDMFSIDPGDLFKIKKDPNKRYGMLLPGGITYTNGSVYTVMEYGAIEEAEEKEDVIWFGAHAMDEDEDEGIEEELPENYSLYSSDFRLASVDTTSGDVTNLGAIPAALRKTSDWTMAAYNGKLMFIGGYSHDKANRGFTEKVWIYDTASRKWTAGAPLPEGRAGGLALQTGDKLVYTLGCSDAETGVDLYEQEYPANLVFNGSKWTESKSETVLKPISIGDPAIIGGNQYLPSDFCVGLTAGGLIYIGCAVRDLGDSFIYDVAKDTFTDTGYNFIQKTSDEQLNSAVVVGSTVYGFTDDMYKMPVKSGLVNVTGTKKGNGKVYGARAYLPGETASITVKAKKHNHIKKLLVNGKAISLTKNTVKKVIKLSAITKAQTVAATFAKDKKIKVTVSKKGKGKVKGGGSYYAGKKVKITATAAKGYYIKSFKVGTKSVKVGKKTVKKVYTIKKIKKKTKVKVVFAKDTSTKKKTDKKKNK